MSAVHHGILRPAFSLQEQYRCPRITYTDASLHLHSAVLLLPEQKLLLGVREEGWKGKKPRTWNQTFEVLERSAPDSPPHIKLLSLIVCTLASLAWASCWLAAYHATGLHAHRSTSVFSGGMINVSVLLSDWYVSFVQDLAQILISKWEADGWDSITVLRWCANMVMCVYCHICWACLFCDRSIWQKLFLEWGDDVTSETQEMQQQDTHIHPRASYADAKAVVVVAYLFIPRAVFGQRLDSALPCSSVTCVGFASLPKWTPSYTRLSSLWAHFSLPVAMTTQLTAVPSLAVSHPCPCYEGTPPHHHHHNHHPLTPPTLPLLLYRHPRADPPLSPHQHSPPPTGPLSLVRGLAVRPSPVSAAAVISSGPSGGLLLTSQAWDRVTSSLNMMGLNQQCVRLNRGGRETKQLRELSASQPSDAASQSYLPAGILLCE